MSKTGKFLKQHENTEVEKELADIHPFSQVKPRKRKKLFIGILVISFIIIYSIIGFLILSDFEKKENVVKDNKKVEKKEIPEPKQSFELNIDNIKNQLSQRIAEISIPELSYYKKTVSEKSRYNYYILKGKKAEIEGKYIDAISFYRKAWKISKKEPSLLYRLALLHFKIGYYKGAEKYAKQFLNINKKHLKGLLLLAKTYEKLGKTKKARIILEEAYFQYPENKDVLENLGRIYEKENALVIAKDIYKILADMGYIEGKLGLARVYEKLNEKKSALKIYRELFNDPNIPESLRSKIENKIISLE
ncbi:tetratricopeptide repeat protein [Persephonella atlantica]|uniref:Tetratricopeptide repeat protein n=1 Tax=Persephonella atlantica TaxID=2699429 RepID=A0ABS1GHX0_9AQUI|nr:tetratricopeptide repeat protein [Persephonella atlantica]MBK3332539.1 tetratricopeptide repeat protein [Persephonella atlantica]